MAFSTQRGRPRKAIQDHDFGTPELRLKHALRLTTEPIDLCLEKNFITKDQHWCGLHLRWLYTLRYGAPVLTTCYADAAIYVNDVKKEDEDWRMMREREYTEAIHLLKTKRRYECVMRLAVFNEQPSFLNQRLHERAVQESHLARELSNVRTLLLEGLDLLKLQWREKR